MRMNDGRKIWWLIAAGTCCAVVGCGGGSDSPTGASQATPAPTPAPTPTPELAAFSPGQHLVGADIDAGRYFADPESGCYWERQSGAGGTLDDVLANTFVGFDSPQEIVDILASDFAFEGDGDCGDWFAEPREGMQVGIPPGRWLVGAQVAPGLYRVDAGAACYWERLANFDGTLRAIIANDFVGDGGAQLVEIQAGDVGFYTDDDCGTWATSSGDVAPAVRGQSRGDIERNKVLDREPS